MANSTATHMARAAMHLSLVRVQPENKTNNNTRYQVINVPQRHLAKSGHHNAKSGHHNKADLPSLLHRTAFKTEAKKHLHHARSSYHKEPSHSQRTSDVHNSTTTQKRTIQSQVKRSHNNSTHPKVPQSTSQNISTPANRTKTQKPAADLLSHSVETACQKVRQLAKVCKGMDYLHPQCTKLKVLAETITKESKSMPHGLPNENPQTGETPSPTEAAPQVLHRSKRSWFVDEDKIIKEMEKVVTEKIDNVTAELKSHVDSMFEIINVKLDETIPEIKEQLFNETSKIQKMVEDATKHVVLVADESKAIVGNATQHAEHGVDQAVAMVKNATERAGSGIDEATALVRNATQNAEDGVDQAVSMVKNATDQAESGIDEATSLVRDATKLTEDTLNDGSQKLTISAVTTTVASISTLACLILILRTLGVCKCNVKRNVLIINTSKPIGELNSKKAQTVIDHLAELEQTSGISTRTKKRDTVAIKLDMENENVQQLATRLRIKPVPSDTQNPGEAIPLTTLSSPTATDHDSYPWIRQSQQNLSSLEEQRSQEGSSRSRIPPMNEGS